MHAQEVCEPHLEPKGKELWKLGIGENIYYLMESRKILCRCELDSSGFR
jgi:hypothetical protein